MKKKPKFKNKIVICQDVIPEVEMPDNSFDWKTAKLIGSEKTKNFLGQEETWLCYVDANNRKLFKMESNFILHGIPLDKYPNPTP